jgi:hypothetical protein
MTCNILTLAKSWNQQQIAGFTDNLLVKQATFLHFSAITGTSLENIMAEPELVPKPNCWYSVGCW